MKHTCAMLAACLLLGFGGCVEREWTINSEPQGAIAYVSGVEVGRTPVRNFEFTYYGDYEVVLRKEGYETLKTNVKISPPWFDMPGADFWSEMAPWTYRVEKESTLKLTPARSLTEEQLRAQAEAARQDAMNPGQDP